MLMEHFLCDDVGGKHNVCGMILTLIIINKIQNSFIKHFWVTAL